ncbi:hypothetical protein [Streptomyces sp. JJ38]|uniref:hypothetical protein n=1 Tax=Streptomyces sp. JJ38 TaxID=2738128 RepID=UPI001C589ECA|nr:hypothetical protein [Streptomyces sp. JJ38]MBW1597677.1 hypothetical protein [Streptomyces sp. JJ38]
MSIARAIWRNDLTCIVRDRTVGVLLFVPLIFLALLRFGVPPLEDQWPALGDHHAVLLGLFCVIVGMFPAFMMAFIMLDERDQGLFAVFRVLPVSPGRLLGHRVTMVVVLGLLYPLLLTLGAGMGSYGVGRALVLAALCAAGGAVALLVAVSLAKNKIECLTAFKALYVLAAGGAAGGLGALEGWNRVPAVLPTYWVFAAYDARGTGAFLTAALVAVLLYGLCAWVFYRMFRRNFS